jgi:DNA processing protein
LSKTTSNLANGVLEKEGLLLSEYEPNKKEDQFSGSKASRIQAGLSRSLILVQSGIDGGSKYTIKAFSTLNRPLGIIDYSVNNSFAEESGFEANQLILNNGISAIKDICGIAKKERIKISSIIPLTNSSDYKVLEKAIQNADIKLFN